MKNIVLCLLSLLLWSHAGPLQAGALEDYTEARSLYLAAAASVAAYNDRMGELSNKYLEQGGWTISHYIPPQGRRGTRYLLARKTDGQGRNTYILAIAGTETADDIKVNLKFDKVYFAGNSLEEFAANAHKTDIPSSEPKVHQGFHQSAQDVLAAKLSPSDVHGSLLALPDLLRNRPEDRLYLTGHSLGGAAAVIIGARLISLGVDPVQLEVITFGAPAVGNAAFTQKYTSSLKLTRVVISGDPVTGVLQTLLGGYRQFGKEAKWPRSDNVDNPHTLAGYMDITIKNYYDKRQLAGIMSPKPPITATFPGDNIYIAPLKNLLPDTLAQEFWYMNEIFQDKYTQALPHGVLAPPNPHVNQLEQAVASGCRWAIVSQVSALRVKEKQRLYYITLYQIVYDTASGAIADVRSFAANTRHLTPLEAFIHAFKELNSPPLDPDKIGR